MEKTWPLALRFFDLGDAHLDHFSHKGCGQGPVRRELNRALGKSVTLQLTTKCVNHCRSRKETAMVCKCRKPDQDALVLEGRNLVTDDLFGFFRSSRKNHSPHFAEGRARWLGNPCQIFVNGFRSAAILHGSLAFCILRFLFHAANLVKFSAHVHLQSCQLNTTVRAKRRAARSRWFSGPLSNCPFAQAAICLVSGTDDLTSIFRGSATAATGA